jgi:hypothetical protein
LSTADELPPMTVLIERVGPFWICAETVHTPDSITMRWMIVEAEDDDTNAE